MVSHPLNVVLLALIFWPRLVYLGRSGNTCCSTRSISTSPGTKQSDPSGNIADTRATPSDSLTVKPVGSPVVESTLPASNATQVDPHQPSEVSSLQMDSKSSHSGDKDTSCYTETQLAQAPSTGIPINDTTYVERAGPAQSGSDNNRASAATDQHAEEQTGITDSSSGNAWFRNTNIRQRIQHCKWRIVVY